MQKLKDELKKKEEENLGLRKTINVVIKIEIDRMGKEKQDLDKKLKHTVEEMEDWKRKYNNVMSRGHMDQLEVREELELGR